MKTLNIGRLAFRVEGEMWNAYWAPRQTSMDGAILIGSIRLNAVTDKPARKDAFIRLMRESFSDAVREIVGVSPSWGAPESAPEHERAGRA
jgi:hypothetical protein